MHKTLFLQDPIKSVCLLYMEEDVAWTIGVTDYFHLYFNHLMHFVYTIFSIGVNLPNLFL